MPIETPGERIHLLKPVSPGEEDTHVQIQEKRLHEEDTYCCCLKWRRSGHVCGIITFLMVLCTLTLVILMGVFHIWFFLPMSIMLFIITFVAYWIEVLASGTLRYLIRFNSVENMISYIDRLRSYPPKITFHCECYHYETRTRTKTESYTDSNGRMSTRTKNETYQEKVVTYRGKEHFHFDAWNDQTPGLSSEICRFKVTRIDFSKALSFEDSYTETCFQDQWEHFNQMYKNRDRHFSSSQSIDIEDFHSKMMCLVEGEKRPFYMHWGVYVVCSLFFLSWPYRLLLDRTTVHGKFQFQKCVRKIPV